ncbi:MAG: molybdate ABC transporter substrate-binding protein [Actinomycetota bacterium]
MKRATTVVVAFALLALPACSGGSSGSGSVTTLTVLAAASLTEAFGRIGAEFEHAHDGVTVRFSFGPSDGLAQQIEAGSPADVYASASPAWMDAVQKDPGVARRVDFARNRLVIVTPLDNPAHVRSVKDLARPGVKLVLAAEGVPAGDYARQIFENAGIGKAALANIVSNEEDVKGVLQKVLLGEADAGVVYVTDVTQNIHEQLTEITIPDDVNVIATYPIAVVSGSDHAALAAQFVRDVAGSHGQRILASFGFLPPS